MNLVSIAVEPGWSRKREYEEDRWGITFHNKGFGE
jgi:hypothetical protein